MPDVQIVSTGARTPLGAQAAPSAAAYRAAISAVGDHPFMVDHLGDPMPGALDGLLDPALMGPGRLLALAESALREACTPLEDAAGSRWRMPLYLGLPEIRPGFDEVDARTVGEGLSRIDDLSVEITDVSLFTDGHAAVGAALLAATEQMRRGGLEWCLVGGVESYFHPDTMEWLDANRQLAGADARSAFVPGEGAGFCLLASDRAARRFRLSPLARVAAVAAGEEPKRIKTADVCLGEGLTATVRAAVEGLRLPDERIGAILCDINGERYRSEEWGFVCLRLARYFEDPTAYVSPADGWGDVGAATGALAAMLACRAADRGVGGQQPALLWMSSEGGLRSAVVLAFDAAGGGAAGGGRRRG